MLSISQLLIQECSSNLPVPEQKKVCQGITGGLLVVAEVTSVAGVGVILGLSLSGTLPISALFAAIPGGIFLLSLLIDGGNLVIQIKSTPKYTLQDQKDLLATQEEKSGEVYESKKKQVFDVGVSAKASTKPFPKKMVMGPNQEQELYAAVDENLAKRISKTTFTDPTKGPDFIMPRVIVFQRLLLLSDCMEDKGERDILVPLMAAELDKLYDGTQISVVQYVRYFDPALIAEIKKSAKNLKIKTFLEEYEEGHRVGHTNRSIPSRADIVRQLDETEDIKTYHFGTAIDDGGCFFGAMAQLLSLHLDQTITEKDLRMQVLDYISQLEKSNRENWVQKLCDAKSSVSKYGDTKIDVALTQEDLEAFGRGGSPSWGRPEVEGQVIAELYGIYLVVYEGSDEYESTPTTIRSYDGDDPIELSTPRDLGETLRIGSMCGHFFPIFTP